MKKTSRRNFAKAMTAALAAAPVALFAKTAASAQTPSRVAQVRPLREDMRFHQDTPPAIEILDGSLIVESAEAFDETGSFLYSLGTDPLIEHIRVIADNGDKIYEDLDASAVINGGEVKSSIIDIVVVNEDNVRSNVKITGGVKIGNDRFFQIKSDKKLKKANQNQTKRRKFKYDHEGNGNNKRVRIESIEITNVYDRKTKFTASPTGTGDGFVPDEFRILIWR